MPDNLSDLIPNVDDLLALEPEELAGLVLQLLNSIPNVEGSGWLHPAVLALEKGTEGYPNESRNSIGRALMEAWMWLEGEGLIAPRPGDLQTNYYFITRRGRQLVTQDDFASYRHASLLPRQVIHPLLAQKIWSTFLRGDYDTAIFQSFKEIEVSVRQAGGFAQTDIGVSLMRKAFDKDNGPLADQALPDAEREAMAHIFAGAIDLFKNPQSHRQVLINDPVEAVGLIMFASHLLRIVDAASSQAAPP